MAVASATVALPAPVAPVDDPPRRQPRSRVSVSVVGVALIVVGLVLAAPVAVLCGLVLAAASLLMRWVAPDIALPLGVTTCVAGSALFGVIAHTVGVDLFSSRLVVAGVLLLVGLLAVGDSRRQGPTAAIPLWSRTLWFTYAPSLIAFAIAVVQATNERAAASWAFFGTDLTRHLALVKQIRDTGALDYAVNAYPGAFHTLLAAVSVPGVPTSGPAAVLTYDLRLVAAATWLSLALLMSTAATLVLRLGPVLGTSRVVTVCAAVVGTSTLLVVNSFAITFVYLGAAPSMLAVVALWSVPLVALEQGRRGGRRLLPLVLATLVVTATVAHMWQALVIVPPAGLLALLLGRRAVGQPRERLRLRKWVTVALVGAVSAAVAYPALVGVLRVGGISIAAIPGAAPGPPVAVLVLTAVALVWSRRGLGDVAVRALLGMTVGLLAMAGLLLYGSGRFDVTQYYVLKALWFAVLVTLPLVALFSITSLTRVQQLLWRHIERFGPWARVARIAVVAFVVALVAGFVLPIPAVSGVLALNTVRDLDGSSESARVFDVAIDYGTKFEPSVTVPVEVGSGIFPNLFLSRVTSSLMSAETGQPENVSPTFAVCSAVRDVAGARPAVVVTTLDPSVLRPFMEADGCADVPVVRIDGPLRTLQGVPTARTATRDRE